MRQLLENLMDSAMARADYADARHVHTRSESIDTRNGMVQAAARGDDEGIGVRVRVGGAWGFAATRGTGQAEAETALQRALAIARAQPAAAAMPLAPAEPARGDWASHAGTDPFAVSLEDKVGLLIAADEAIAAAGGDAVRVRTGTFHAQVE